jgi:hypothetical protein
MLKSREKERKKERKKEKIIIERKVFNRKVLTKNLYQKF